MRIVASNIQLSSAHLLDLRQTTTEQLRVRAAPAPAGQRPDRDQPGRSRLEHDADRLARLLKKYFEGTQQGRVSARLIQRIERLTDRVGRDLAAIQGTAATGGADPATAQAATGGTGSSRPTPELDVHYRRETGYREIEATSFRASGTVVTADGRQIDFTQALDLARAYARQETVSLRAAIAVPADGATPATESGADRPAPDATPPTDSAAATTSAHQALALAGGVLGYDANGDGTIDPATELVGASGNGFAELAELDQDGNGFVDEGDAGFGKLAIVSSGTDGVAAGSLLDRGVGALYTGSVATPYTYTDPDNQPVAALARSGIYVNENGTTGIAHQVDVLI